MVSHRRWFRHKTARIPDGSPAGLRSGGLSIYSLAEAGARAEDHGARLPDGRGKRILFINQYYWPDHASTAQHLTDLAESLAARGYECHVLSSQSRYQPGEPRPPAHEERAGVRVHRVRATSRGRRATWTRLADYLSFHVLATASALALPSFDFVVTLTTPPLIGLLGTALKWLRGTRHVYWSMDLHPDASLALGRWSQNNPFGRLLYWLSGFVYRHADKVVVLGPYMADRIALKHVAPDRIATIPVWSRRDEVYPIPRALSSLRKSLGLGDAFVAMYSGNMGLAHSFDEFLEAARRLRHDPGIVFIFAGGGPRRAEVTDALEREGLTNIRLLDYVPRSQLHASLSLADVHLISMRPEMTGIVVPGKLYGAMAAGRPTIFVGPAHCEAADTIRSAGCGIAVAPGDADALVGALELLAGDSSLRRRMGERARLTFLGHYEQKLCCRRWSDLFDELAAPPLAKSRSIAPPEHFGTTRKPPPPLHARPGRLAARARVASIATKSMDQGGSMP
jgi:glycosyltransferase involved in cell wall biosynthesis